MTERTTDSAEDFGRLESLIPTPRPWRIPLEIVDLIIDYAHADRRTLSSCSLVCSAWLLSARYHIFSNISLHAENVSSFIELASRPSSALPPLIKRVDIRDSRENARLLANAELVSGLTCLADNVTALSITSDFETPLSHSSLATFCTFKYLIELKLAECVFGKFADMQEFVCSFPALQILSLEAEWPEPHHDLGNASLASRWHPPSTLRELSLKCEIKHALDWFLVLSPIPTISVLGLYGVDATELPLVNRYLQALGPGLTHLKCLPSGFEYSSSSRPIFDTSHNSHLQYLRLEIDCDIFGLTLAQDTMLRLHDDHYMADLELSFYSLRQNSKWVETWAGLDEVLARPRFASMQTTVCTNFGGDLAKEALPRCYARNALRIKRH